ncbi:glycosyltransferase family 4 protein [Maribacter sp. CXY002]|uniref:glycosyltransferase family 4 protein n=1 Tax=Maribacter luteocoastalis TaxID=3407671 RepID=UPI003B670B49
MTNKPLKIVFLLSRIETTGVTTHTLDLAKGLTDLGHELMLITGGISREKNERVELFYGQFKEMGVTIKEFKTPSGNLLKKGVQTVGSILNMLKWIKGYNPQVIHAQSPYMTFVPWLLGKKFTTTIHQMGLRPNLKFKTPTHVIAISEESKKDSILNYGITEDQVSIIHHGVSDRYAQPITEDEKKSLKKQLGIQDNKRIIGAVGSLSLRKGTDIMVKALEGLDDGIKQQIHFIFLGGELNSKEFGWLHAMISEANIGKFTQQVAFRDPKPFYDIFDIFVLPSRMESFPLVTLEAMMSGCCPIRSNTEGAHEQITDGVNGLLFTTEAHKELTLCLTKLVSDTSLRDKLAKNAKKKALEEFTIPEMTKQTLKIYDKIKIH